MALQDFFNGKYGDDLVISIPDGPTATVKEIRESMRLKQRDSTLDQAEMAFARKFQEATSAGWIDQNGKIVAPPTDKEIRKAAAVEFGVTEDDPLLGSVVKEFKAELAKRDEALNAMRTEIQGALGTVTNVVKTSVGRYLDGQYRSEFDQVTKSLPKGVKADYEAAFKYATENNLKDKDGVLKIADAVKHMTFDDVMKAKEASLREEVTKDIEHKNKLSSVARPRTSSPEFHREKTDFNPFRERTDAHGNKINVAKSFDEALAEASSDEALLQSAFATASFGSN